MASPATLIACSYGTLSASGSHLKNGRCGRMALVIR